MWLAAIVLDKDITALEDANAISIEAAAPCRCPRHTAFSVRMFVFREIPSSLSYFRFPHENLRGPPCASLNLGGRRRNMGVAGRDSPAVENRLINLVVVLL